MIKKVIKKIIYGYKSSSEDYIKYLRSRGIEVGNNCHIFCPKETSIDTLNPHLLSIGNNVKITGPTTILTHDYSTTVLNNLDKRIYGKQKRTVVGNNVFLGWGCTILAGTEIKDNTIIGAGAIVSGELEENSVYVGNPAKKVCSIEEYRNKIKENQKKEATKIFIEYKRKNKHTPPIELFHEYFYVFTKSKNDLNKRFKKKLQEEGFSFENKESDFNNYKEFCDFCEEEYAEKGDC